jgi:hypothetical protein
LSSTCGVASDCSRRREALKLGGADAGTCAVGAVSAFCPDVIGKEQSAEIRAASFQIDPSDRDKFPEMQASTLRHTSRLPDT